MISSPPDQPASPGNGTPQTLQAGLLKDGRLHLQNGPIDLIIGALGEPEELRKAYMQAYDGFDGLLEALADDFESLSRPITSEPKSKCGVGDRMINAVSRFSEDHFVTPMAAVAGAVADTVLSVMVTSRRVKRAYVNNGGDIALHIAEGEEMTVGVVPQVEALVPQGAIKISASMGARGVATSGWSGRSMSLGIADAVTVLAESAAAADAAATLIANDVDLEHPAIERARANSLVEGSDLGDLLVTTAVGSLTENEVSEALASGEETAQEFLDSGAIIGAFLIKDRQMRIVGDVRHCLQSMAGKNQESRGNGGGFVQ